MHAQMRRIALVLAATIALLGGAFFAAPALAGQHIPSNFHRHENPYWVWYGPANWVDSYGQNDLIVSSPTGEDYLHYGAGGVICADTPAHFFQQIRAYTKQSNGFYGKTLKSSKYTQVGNVRHLPSSFYGPYGYRQQTKWKGKRSNGEQIQGEVTFDFFYVDSSDCGQAFSVRSAPSQGFNNAIDTLRKIQKLIFYN